MIGNPKLCAEGNIVVNNLSHKANGRWHVVSVNHQYAKLSVQSTVGENPTYVKANHQHRTNYYIIRGDKYSEVNRKDISGCNASECIEPRNTEDYRGRRSW